MAHAINRLSPRFVETAKKPGMHADGAGLYLRVKSATARSYVFVWHENPSGRRREMGLGAPPGVKLAHAREKAQAAREEVAKGGDPVASKRKLREIPTFGAAADQFMEDQAATVRSDKSRARWKRALGAGGYADSLRSIRVDQITTDDVMGVLRPMWETKAASAVVLRGYIETVLDRAKVGGHRSGDNPALWKGHLAVLLPKRQKLSRGHHAAIAYVDMPEFMADLRARTATAALALEFLILTASRTSEVLGATWAEIDLKAKVWTIPAERMKAGREHRVALSVAAVAVLTKAAKLGAEGLVFPSASGNGQLSNMSMAMLLRRMDRDEITVHGFRAAFSTWVGETTNFPTALAEAALAHSVGDETERAYRRGDALERRRKLMESWSGWCEPKPGGNVLGMTRKGRAAA